MTPSILLIHVIEYQTNAHSHYSEDR